MICNTRYVLTLLRTFVYQLYCLCCYGFTDFIKNEGFPKHLIEQLEFEKERERKEKEREELEKAMCKVNNIHFNI